MILTALTVVTETDTCVEIYVDMIIVEYGIKKNIDRDSILVDDTDEDMFIYSDILIAFCTNKRAGDKTKHLQR